MNHDLTFSVLQDRGQIDAAERRLLDEGLVPAQQPTAARLVDRVLTKAGRGERAANLRPDPIKSWDVLRSIEAVKAVAGPDDPVLDMGSVGCAMLPALHRLGFRDLHGIDLNPQVLDMAHADAIDYRIGDLMHTPFADATFAAITSISVIEHGVADEALLDEVARLLRPGGVFAFSTDYWPEKIDTSGIELFDLPWRIFSAEEIEAFAATARARGLQPAGALDGPLRTVSEKPIHFADRDYTFLWGALVRAPS